MTHDLTPYILAAIGLMFGWVGWLSKTVIAQGKELTAVRTAFSCYLEGIGKAAAKVLDSPNPAPPRIRQLLRLYQQDEIDSEGRRELREWLQQAASDDHLPKSERNAAFTMLEAMSAIKHLKQLRHHG